MTYIVKSTKKLTQEEFISRCKDIHGDRFKYDKTVYVNSRTDILVECTQHGPMEINARAFIVGYGCRKCNIKWNNYIKRKRLTQEEFIEKATKKHNGFYSYTKSTYVNSRTKITITCPIHGDFEQGAGGHLEGYGCQTCADLKHGEYRPWFIKTYFDCFPEKKNLPAILYLLYSKEEDFYKVGITTKTVEERMKYISQYKFTIIDFVSGTMYNMAAAEQDILANTIKYKPKKYFGGYSECIKEFVNIHQYVPKRVGYPIKEEVADYDICSK